MPDPCAQLALYLEDTGLPYRALSPLGETRARVCFLGMFQGHAVAWDAEILTLKAYAEQRMGQSSAPPPRTWRPFIEIGARAEAGVPLRVGLAVPLIDAATVLCTIVMIRNYKRLRPGRHEFGEAVTFAAGWSAGC